MPKYVAFLRAINVGGRVVKMDRLKSLFEELPISEVDRLSRRRWGASRAR